MNCIYSDILYTGTSIEKEAYLLFEQGKISGITNFQQGQCLGRFEVVTPAFIDPHSHIGMIRAGEPENESEVNDNQDPILTLADSLDSLQMDDPALKEAVEMGVLYSCILPGSGNIIGGLSSVIRSYGKNSSEAFIGRAGLKSAFGYNPMSTSSWEGTRPTTRMGAMAILRKKFDQVLQKEDKLKRQEEEGKIEETFSAEENFLREILAGRKIMRAHVHKTDDIAALLRLVDEFGLEVTVEHAMAVDQPDIFMELKRRNIPVTYGPLDSFAYKPELRKESWRNIQHLLESGVQFGLMSDHPVTPARQLLLQTRWFIRCGLNKAKALEVITLGNARILNLEENLGSLVKGKWASFVGWNGDPFDLSSYPVAVYAEGEPVYQTEN